MEAKIEIPLSRLPLNFARLTREEQLRVMALLLWHEAAVVAAERARELHVINSF